MNLFHDSQELNPKGVNGLAGEFALPTREELVKVSTEARHDDERVQTGTVVI